MNDYNISEIPDKWVVIKILDNEHKIFASWAGGYLDGDRWKLNSGITKVEEDDKYYLSVYVPQKREINVILLEDKEDQMFLIDTAMKILSSSETERIINVELIKTSALDTFQLNETDVLVCSGITNSMLRMASDLRNFSEKGGRIIFFLTENPDNPAINQLWRDGLLPALPEAREQSEYLFSAEISLGMLTDVISYMLDIDLDAKVTLLAELDVHRRAELLLEHLDAAATDYASGGSCVLTFPPQFSAN